MKDIRSFVTISFILFFGGIFLLECKKDTPGSVNSNSSKEAGTTKKETKTKNLLPTGSPSTTTSTLPSTLKSGLILRYHRPGIRDRVIGYIHSINNQEGTFTVQHLFRDETAIFYGTRIIPMENLKYGHRLDHSFPFDGGRVEKGGAGLTFLASEEILEQLKTTGNTTFKSTGDGATSLQKTGEKPYELLYNGQKITISSLQTQTGPLNSSFYRSFPIWFWDQPTFPLMLRYEQTFLGSVDEVSEIAKIFRKTLESKQALLTGSLYMPLYSLMGGTIHREITLVAKDIWAQGIIPVLKNQPNKKMVIQVFQVSQGAASLKNNDRFGVSYGVKAINQFLLAGGVPADRFIVQAGTSLENLPEEISPIGQDLEFRILIRLE